MKKLFFLYFIFITFYSIAGTGNVLKLSFQPHVGTEKLRVDNSYYKFQTGDSIQFNVLKFYISGIELMNENKIIWKEENSYHLIDASDEKLLNISLEIPEEINLNKVKFYVGIDSLTNVYGVSGGDLDPTRGMYWTWQSGYINFKLEGKSPLCNTRNHEFEFHLGGYRYPFNSLQTVILNTTEKNNINIEMDIEKLFSGSGVQDLNQIMSPGKEALYLSKKLPGIFSVQNK